MPPTGNKGDQASNAGDSDHSDTANVDVPDDDDENFSDVESAEEEEEESDDHAAVMWTGYGKRIPVLVFKADAIVQKKAENKVVGEKYHLAYKIVKTECKLVRSILSSHGFHEVHPNSNDYNLTWTGSHLKPYVLRGLQEFQKINHFPRSYEITRKDRLYKNVQRMQQTKGFKNFDFVPHSFIIPGEFQDFCSCYLKDKGPYIVKPIASSRGRGIFLVNHPEQVPLDDTVVVCKYLGNPLLIDGFKFDVRLYVSVTSYDPLIVYLYEEGLTRFATVRFDKSARNIRNQCMHLTNYSVNKKSGDYVRNDDPDVEDYGNKWSLGAMLRYLRSQGRDTTALMMRIEDVIIKTLISAELAIATACKMFMPFKGNCFELYGFDILIDDNLRPWVLEVNLSPSLACDAPMDLKIKSNMLSDLFSLVGFVCHDPMVRKMQQSKRNQEVLGRPQTGPQRRPVSASSAKGAKAFQPSGTGTGLNSEEIRIVRRAKEEQSRRGGWVRIFPSPDSWELYGSYLQFQGGHNLMLYQQLFPERARNVPAKPTSASYSSGLARTKNIHLHSTQYPQLHVSNQADEALAQALQRSLQYERKLSCLGDKRRKRSNRQRNPGGGAPNVHSGGSYRGVLVQGVAQESHSAQRALPPSSSKRTGAPHSAPPRDRQQPQGGNPPPHKTKSVTMDPPRSEKDSEEQEAAVTSQPETPPPPRQPTQPPPLPTPPSTPSPPPPPPPPKYNVVELLEKGKTMTKVQARFAFATYLLRVQQRLMSETSGNDTEDVDAANEQMDLVLRFLKRAAGNLQQPFKVVVPSRKLHLNDRRRILAKQLGDFVHIYNKETDQLRQRANLEKKHLKRPPAFTQNEGLDEEKFNNFVNIASESELEEVLTTYTKLNKSASIFLGSNSKSTHESRTPGVGGTNSVQVDPVLAKRKESGGDNTLAQTQARLEEAYMGRDSAPLTTAYSSSPPEQPLTNPAENKAPNCAPKSTSSVINYSNTRTPYGSAVHAYGVKLADANWGASTRQRPHSAKSHKNTVVSTIRHRPLSANNTRPSSSQKHPPSSVRERPDGAENVVEPAAVDEETINAALHKLSMRQQQRQYSATRNSAIFTDPQLSNNDDDPIENPVTAVALNETYKPPINGTMAGKPPIHFSAGSFVQSSLVRTRPGSSAAVESVVVCDPTETDNSNEEAFHKHRRAMSADPRSHSSSTRSANDTFESFVEDARYEKDLMAAYNQVTGVLPQNNYKPTQGSTQYQQVLHQQQQRMMEQSKVLLEQSKAKHQAMVAQAHAATHRQDSTSDAECGDGVGHPRSKYNQYVSTQSGGAYTAMSTAYPTTSIQPAIPTTNSTNPVFTPKPPPGPSGDRKPTHRLARTNMLDEPSASNNFYSSLKYDTYTGTTTKPIHRSGYNTGI